MPEAGTVRRRLPRGALIGAPFLLLAWSVLAPAGNAGSDIGKLRARFDSLQRSEEWRGATEEALVDDLDAVVTRFRSGGGPAAQAASLRRLVRDAHRRHAGWLKERRDALVAEDGDLEAAQDAPEWRAREELAMRTLYHLNWILLEAATRYESQDPDREQWLRRAANGFGEFTVVEGDSSLVAENLFGRGLCYRALGRWDEAVRDLTSGAELPQEAETRARIGTALVETLIEADRVGDALLASEALLGRGASAAAEFVRAKAVLVALHSLELPPGRRSVLRREVIDLLARLERKGGNWAVLAQRLVTAGITRPEEWIEEEQANATTQWVVAEALRARGRCREAITLYEKLVDSEEPDRVELLLSLGYCRFRLGEFMAAYETLAVIEKGAGGDGAVADAAYLRFKAAEALHQEKATAANAERLGKVAAEYVAGFPDHRHAPEARYRTGELERARGDRLAAAAAFDAAAGDPALSLQAMFQAAQCYVEEWEERERAGADEEALAKGAIERLRKFLERVQVRRRGSEARAADEAILVGAEAHARVQLALVLSRRRSAGDLEEALEWLKDFDSRYPAETELGVKASAVRAIVLLRVGRFAEVEGAVRRFLDAPQGSERDFRLMRRLAAQGLEVAAQQARAGHPDVARKLRRSSLSIYEELLDAVERGAVKGESEEGLRALIVGLRRDSK